MPVAPPVCAPPANAALNPDAMILQNKPSNYIYNSLTRDL
jgi:hypothetical protein